MGQSMAAGFLFPVVDSKKTPAHLVWTDRGNPLVHIDYESLLSTEDFMYIRYKDPTYPPLSIFAGAPYRRRLLIYFHGNGEDLGHVQSHGYRLAESLGFSVLLVEYPGYGVFKNWRKLRKKRYSGSNPTTNKGNGILNGNFSGSGSVQKTSSGNVQKTTSGSSSGVDSETLAEAIRGGMFEGGVLSSATGSSVTASSPSFVLTGAARALSSTTSTNCYGERKATSIVFGQNILLDNPYAPSNASAASYHVKIEEIPVSECNCAEVDKVAKYALEYARRQLNYKDEDMIITGRSIGTGAASKLCSTNKKSCFHALVLQSPYYSISTVAARFGWGVGQWINFDDTHWDNYKQITEMHPDVPIMILHGDKDEIIDREECDKLAGDLTKIPRKVSWKILSGRGHNDIDLKKDFLVNIERFLRHKHAEHYPGATKLSSDLGWDIASQRRAATLQNSSRQTAVVAEQQLIGMRGLAASEAERNEAISVTSSYLFKSPTLMTGVSAGPAPEDPSLMRNYLGFMGNKPSHILAKPKMGRTTPPPSIGMMDSPGFTEADPTPVDQRVHQEANPSGNGFTGDNGFKHETNVRHETASFLSAGKRHPFRQVEERITQEDSTSAREETAVRVPSDMVYTQSEMMEDAGCSSEHADNLLPSDGLLLTPYVPGKNLFRRGDGSKGTVAAPGIGVTKEKHSDRGTLADPVAFARNPTHLLNKESPSPAQKTEFETTASLVYKGAAENGKSNDSKSKYSSGNNGTSNYGNSNNSPHKKSHFDPPRRTTEPPLERSSKENNIGSGPTQSKEVLSKTGQLPPQRCSEPQPPSSDEAQLRSNNPVPQNRADLQPRTTAPLSQPWIEDPTPTGKSNSMHTNQGNTNSSGTPENGVAYSGTCSFDPNGNGADAESRHPGPTGRRCDGIITVATNVVPSDDYVSKYSRADTARGDISASRRSEVSSSQYSSDDRSRYLLQVSRGSSLDGRREMTNYQETSSLQGGRHNTGTKGQQATNGIEKNHFTNHNGIAYQNPAGSSRQSSSNALGSGPYQSPGMVSRPPPGAGGQQNFIAANAVSGGVARQSSGTGRNSRSGSGAPVPPRGPAFDAATGPTFKYESIHDFIDMKTSRVVSPGKGDLPPRPLVNRTSGRVSGNAIAHSSGSAVTYSSSISNSSGIGNADGITNGTGSQNASTAERSGHYSTKSSKNTVIDRNTGVWDTGNTISSAISTTPVRVSYGKEGIRTSGPSVNVRPGPEPSAQRLSHARVMSGSMANGSIARDRTASNAGSNTNATYSANGNAMYHDSTATNAGRAVNGNVPYGDNSGSNSCGHASIKYNRASNSSPKQTVNPSSGGGVGVVGGLGNGNGSVAAAALARHYPNGHVFHNT